MKNKEFKKKIFVERKNSLFRHLYNLRREIIQSLDYFKYMALYKGNKKIIILTFPRSGTHWLTFIISKYLDAYVSLGISSKRKEKFFNRDYLANKYKRKGFVVLATHNKKFTKTKAVYLKRDKKDIFVSKYYWDFENKREFFSDNKMDKEKLKNKFLFKKYLQYNLSEADSYGNPFIHERGIKKNNLIITYEDLTINPFQTVSKVLNYYNIPINRKKLKKIIKEEEFSKKKGEALKIKNKRMINVLRKGKIGGWKEYFDIDCLKLLKKYEEQAKK